MANLLRDLTFAWRTLWQRPLPTAAAIFCLAVGIAAVTGNKVDLTRFPLRQEERARYLPPPPA